MLSAELTLPVILPLVGGRWVRRHSALDYESPISHEKKHQRVA